MDIKKFLNKKKLIIVCGVGGVGKTTLSAALALKAASLGKKSLVITVDPAKRLASILNLKSPCPEPKKIWPSPNGGALFACLLEAKDTFDALIKKLASPDLQELLFNNKLYQQLSMMLAGMQEYMAMEKLFSLTHGKKFDIIIVDTPPARHAIDFLLAPVKIRRFLEQSWLKWMVQPSLRMGKIGTKIFGGLGHMAGGTILMDIAHLLQISLELLEGFAGRANEMHDLLRGQKCALVLTALAPSISIQETLDFQKALHKLGFPLEGLLLNRMPLKIATEKKMQEAIVFGKKQTDRIWHQAAELLKKRLCAEQKIQKNIAHFSKNVDWVATLPQMEDGVIHFSDLLKLSQAF